MAGGKDYKETRNEIIIDIGMINVMTFEDNGVCALTWEGGAFTRHSSLFMGGSACEVAYLGMDWIEAVYNSQPCVRSYYGIHSHYPGSIMWFNLDQCTR